MTSFIVSWGHTLTPELNIGDLFTRWLPCTAVCFTGLETSRKCRYLTSRRPGKPWSRTSANQKHLWLGSPMVVIPGIKFNPVCPKSSFLVCNWDFDVFLPCPWMMVKLITTFCYCNHTLIGCWAVATGNAPVSFCRENGQKLWPQHRLVYLWS